MQATLQPVSHISIDQDGRAWITGANTKVIEIAMDVHAHGWSADEIVCQHPHLTLAQVHAALAHYYDHREQIDAEMGADESRSRETREHSLPQSPLRDRLRQLGRLPSVA